jgi:hypothetical protein
MTMAQHQSLLSAVTDMEGDLRRARRLFEALRMIADAGALDPHGLSQQECDALEEIAECGCEVAARLVSAWENAFDMGHGERRTKESAHG